ncbi:MAG: hypothetical protein FWF57_04385 [Defluviitaleaceae bacterium]|nr:hypothetical protein [Defluviitaleaceae bacterium]
MEKHIRLGILYDFYGELLTEKQQKMFEMYYNENLSLREIAEDMNITYQAVRDNIKRAENSILEYEEKLEIFKKYKLRKQKLENLIEEINLIDALNSKKQKILFDIKSIIEIQ